MIFWFSGTGNSLWTAQLLASILNDRLIDLTHAHLNDCRDYTLQRGESLGWVFPVHAWGPPRLVLDFARRIKLDGYTPGTHCWMAATCGDDVGLTVPIMRRALGDIHLNAAFSVQMPNTYVCLPGFDVDPVDLQQRKLNAARPRIDAIALAIAERRNVTDVVTGRAPWLKSRILRPLFNATCTRDSNFSTGNDCLKCGLCLRNCPTGNISADSNGLPQWNGHCTTCLRCLHVCPQHAIQKGAHTASKGRYHHKVLRVQ